MNGQRRVVPVGERALLVDLESTRAVHALARWLAASDLARLTEDVVPASRTLFVRATHASDVSALTLALRQAEPDIDAAAPIGRVVELPVTYDGEDLAAVAEATGLDAAAVVRHHADREYEVAYFGFAPGLALLAGVPAEIAVPRRDSPRVRVRPGAVAIANEHTLVYPGGTPGGWNIIGTCHGPPLWNAESVPPHAIDIGDRIVFRRVP